MRRALLALLLAAAPAFAQEAMNSAPCRMDGADCPVGVPAPTLANAGKVPTVNAGGTAYEMVTGSSVPATCTTAGMVPVFLGSPLAMGCDAGLTYDAATDTLASGSLGLASAGTFKFSTDTGLARASAGLLKVTSGGSNLGSLQSGNVTVTALATPSVTSPLTVNGTPGSTTYGYKAVAFLNDGTSTAASAETTVATGPATLGAVNNITVATPAVTNMAYYKLYRTTGNGAAGETPPRLIYTGTTPSFIDVGAAGTVETPATTNTTGTVAATELRNADGAYSLKTNEGGSWAFYLSSVRKSVLSSLRMGLGSDVAFGWASIGDANAASDVILTRAAAATLQLGAAASATPVGQKLQAQGARPTTDTNISGADLRMSAGLGTGLANTTAAGRRGDYILQTQSRGSTGTGATTSVDRLGLAGQVVTLTESSATPVLDVAVASGTAAGGTVWYTIRSDDATDFQSLRGQVQWAAVNKAGTLTCAIGLVGTEVAALSTGTLTNTATCTTGTNLITINLNAVSSLTQTTLHSYISWQMDGTGVATTK